MGAILELIATLLGTLSRAGSVFSPHVSGILGAVSGLVTQGEAAVPILSALTGHVTDMAATASLSGSGTPSAEQVSQLHEHLVAANALAPPPAAA